MRSCGADNGRELPQSRRIKPVVLDNRLEATALAAVVELDLGEARSVERNRLLARRGLQQPAFLDEQELRFGIHEPPDQPRTRHPVHLDVPARDPFHTDLFLRRDCALV